MKPVPNIDVGNAQPGSGWSYPGGQMMPMPMPMSSSGPPMMPPYPVSNSPMPPSAPEIDEKK